MNDNVQREKAIKEVRLLEKLSHTSIIRYLENFIEDNEMYIAVEWAEKGDLKLLLRTLKAKE